MREMSDEVVEVTVVEKAAEAVGGKSARRRVQRKDAAEGGDGLVKWERFLPKIALRVLLVEADDSTRQTISALLRKCSYRVMSTQDSVNTVYKCMLKGAADYLVKPLRRNELINLWQHVWRRRQSSLSPGSFPLDESVSHQKPEGAQSSCTRPEMEGESADVEDSTKEAIDFIGASFTRNGQDNREESVRIELDLSLRRPNQSSGDKPSLHPSSCSAFTRYVHKPLQTQCSVSPLVPNQRTNVAGSEDDNIVVTNQYNSSEPPPSAPRRNEASFYNSADSPGPPSWPGQGSYPTRVPIKSIQFTSPNTTPASLSPSPSSISPHEYSSMFHPYNGNKPEGLQEQDVEERRHVSSATEHSTIGNHCTTSYIDYHHLHQQLVEKKNEEGYSSSVGKTQQSLREAALNKFRMKRKDRCFDKKVRYESRKKPAEQRPRIKGQFVRQVQSTETSTQAAPQ